MTVTFARTGLDYGSGGFTAPTPAGTGGALVVIVGFRDGDPQASTPAHWELIGTFIGPVTEGSLRVWISRNATPSMSFTRGTGEAGVVTYRISDADPVAATYVADELGYAFVGVTRDWPDVGGAPANGALLAVVAMQGGNSVASTSDALPEDYDGRMGSAGWWAGSMACFHLDAVTPNFPPDYWPGTYTLAGDNITNGVTIVVATGPSTTVPAAIDDLAATPGDTEVELTNTAPDDGGSAITDYEYQYRDPLDVPARTAPTFVAAAAGSGGVGAITPALPGSLAVGDVLLCFVESANQAISITNEAGGSWVEVGTQAGTGTAGSTGATRLAVFGSIYNGTQTAPTVGDSGDHTYAFIAAFRGCDPAAVIDAISSVTTNTGPTTYTFPSITTSIDNCLIIVVKADDYDNTSTTRYSSWTNAGLSSLTERFDAGTTQGNGGGLGMATGVKATAGATGTTTVAQNSSITADAGVTIALTPAPTTAPWTTFPDGTSSTPGTIVTGLTNDIEYEFRGRAVNAVGAGPWSNVPTATPVAAPGDQTISGAVAAVHVVGVAGTLTAGPVTITGAIAAVVVVGISGSASAPIEISGAVAEVHAVGVDGSAGAAGTAEIPGTAAEVRLLGVAGTLAGTSDIDIAGTVAVVQVAGVAGALALGPVSVPGATAAVRVTGEAGTTVTGPVDVAGAVAAVHVVGVSGALSAPIEIGGSVAVVQVAAIAGTVTADTATISGAVGGVRVIGVPGSTDGTAIILGATATVVVAGVAGDLVGGGTVEIAAAVAVVRVDGAPGIVTAGPVIIAAAIATVRVSGVSGAVGGDVDIAGGVGVVHVVGVAGSIAAGTVEIQGAVAETRVLGVGGTVVVDASTIAAGVALVHVLGIAGTMQLLMATDPRAPLETFPFLLHRETVDLSAPRRTTSVTRARITKEVDL